VKLPFFANSESLLTLPLLALVACGSSSTPIPTPVATPAAKPQIVFEGPGVPGSNSSQQISTANLDGSNLVHLPQDGLDKFLAHFSPDGTHLLYTKFLTGQYGDPGAQTDIFSYSFASTTETRLTTLGRGFQAAWSPNGQQIAFGTYDGSGLFLMNPDGTGQQLVAQPSGTLDDLRWDDFAWSSDNWILFTVAQNTNNCFKVRLDKIRPDGSSRTQVTDGGPNCTPPGLEQYGDSDPGFSADGQTIYSSRGLSPLPADPTQTLRHLYAFSSAAYTPGKVETDLSITSKPDCKVGVPKGSPGGTEILLFLFCPSDPEHVGVTLTNTSGTSWTFIVTGFGPDWNPAAQP
jgi:Tol biopolymer transport system component